MLHLKFTKKQSKANLAGNLGSWPLLFSKEAKHCWRKRFVLHFFSFFSSIFLVSISWAGTSVVKGPQRGGSAVTRGHGHPGATARCDIMAHGCSVTEWMLKGLNTEILGKKRSLQCREVPGEWGLLRRSRARMG